MSIVNLSQIAQALDAMMPELTPVPVGTIDFAHDVPDGWLECNGAAVSRTKYARLFKKIGTKYGAGDGSTTFNLPNLHHRVLEGTNTTSEVAQYQEAGLPDISGAFTATDDDAYGAFKVSVKRGNVAIGSEVNTYWKDFKASNSNALYKGSSLNVPSLRLLAIMKY